MKLNLQAAIDGKLDTELNLALCEWLGWTKVDVFTWLLSNPPQRKPKEWINVSDLPNHINAPESLGLVHEVEQMLTATQWPNYVTQLCSVTEDRNGEGLVHATARQRVIAILQTVEPEVFGNFLCESCEESDVQKVLEREPYSPDYWICPSCHGTYPEWTYPKETRNI